MRAIRTVEEYSAKPLTSVKRSSSSDIVFQAANPEPEIIRCRPEHLRALATGGR